MNLGKLSCLNVGFHAMHNAGSNYSSLYQWMTRQPFLHYSFIILSLFVRLFPMLVVHAGLAAESSNHEVDQKQELENPEEDIEGFSMDPKLYPVSLQIFTNFSSRIFTLY